MTRKNFWQTLASCSAMLFLLLFTSSASAQDCETDSDCSDGQTCEVIGGTACACPGCPPGEECPPCDCGEPEEILGCVTAPITCETDDDCPSYLSCSEDTPSATTCSVDENGNEECEDHGEDHGGENFCTYIPQECQSDSDCDDNFTCEMYPTACPDIACAEGEECPELPCESSDEGYCEPQQIECGSDSDCPSDWICYTNEYEVCSGGGSTGCDCAPCAEDEECEPCDCGEPEEPEDFSCETETESACIPADWEDFVESGFGGGSDFDGPIGTPRNDVEESGTTNDSDNVGAPQTPEDDNTSTDPEENVEGSCSVTNVSNTSNNGLLVTLLLGMGAFFIRRRRT